MEKVMKKFRKFVRLPNGKQDSASFDRKTDADAWFRRRKLEVQRSKALGIDQVEEISFREAAKTFLAVSPKRTGGRPDLPRFVGHLRFPESVSTRVGHVRHRVSLAGADGFCHG